MNGKADNERQSNVLFIVTVLNVYSEYIYFVIKKMITCRITLPHLLHCADASYAHTIYAARDAIPVRNGMDERKDINGFLAWKFREHFIYTPGQEGCYITIQYKICLP